MTALPAIRLLDPHHSIVEAVDAGSLLAAAGIQAVSDAPTVDLAAFDANAKLLKEIADEARGAVSDELVRRRDREVSGTLHVEGWTITVPSRAAGTVGYDPDRTAAALDGLVGDDLISAQARHEACLDRRAPAQVPWAILHNMVAALDDLLSGDECDALASLLGDALESEPGPLWSPQPAKLAALAKLGGEVAEAIAACRVDVVPPRRRATVKRTKAEA